MRCEPKLKETSRFQPCPRRLIPSAKCFRLEAFVVQSPWANASEEEVQAVTAYPAQMFSRASPT